MASPDETSLSLEQRFVVARSAERVAREHLPPLDETHGEYRLRFALDDHDRQRIFRLRYEVFALELGEALAGAHAIELDRDPFDAQCHHLMVEDRATGEVVGTYRLQVLEIAREGLGFYSAGEFDLSTLEASVIEDSVELGRACVARDHRNKAVLFLLWRGLGSYLLWNHKQHFFGCSSLTSRDPREGLALHRDLTRDGKLSRRFAVSPLPGFECLGRPLDRAIELPKLFAIYLRHGAEVLGPPAIDREFGTIDFLTLLDIDKMGRRLFKFFTLGLPRRSEAR